MKTIPFFRAGRHQDSHGRTVEFTEADVQASIAGYDPALHRAPLVIGHPKGDAPAYGWVRSIQRNASGELVAIPEQLNNDFSEGVAAGTWYPRSASWYPPNDPRNPKPGIYYLRHIGFLGAQPPAIKGLSAIQFDDGVGVVEIEFADPGPGLQASSSLWRRLRDWIVNRYGLEEADKALPSWEIDDVTEAAFRDEARGPAFTEPQRKAEATPVTKDESARIRAENKRLKEQLARRVEDDRAAAHADHLAYAEQLVSRGMKPAHVPAVVAALDFAEAGDFPLEFGEDDDRQPLSEGLKAIFSELAGGVSFAEQAARGRAGKGVAPAQNPLLADAEARTTTR
ncbi:TPA: peptidase [Pseudomonas aeruginosa]